jgi:hypothetical protein
MELLLWCCLLSVGGGRTKQLGRLGYHGIYPSGNVGHVLISSIAALPCLLWCPPQLS